MKPEENDPPSVPGAGLSRDKQHISAETYACSAPEIDFRRLLVVALHVLCAVHPCPCKVLLLQIIARTPHRKVATQQPVASSSGQQHLVQATATQEALPAVGSTPENQVSPVVVT